MRQRPTLLVLMALLAATLVPAVAEARVPVGSPVGFNFEAAVRGQARGVAERTFIYAHAFGPHHRRYKRRFHLRGQQSFAVRAVNGSTLTAFQATLNSVDGTGDIVLLFDELGFVGYASNRMSVNLTLGRRHESDSDVILVRYGIYRRRDAFCCPSGRRGITYDWDGTRVVASGSPPTRAFGELMPRLQPKRLKPSGSRDRKNPSYTRFFAVSRYRAGQGGRVGVVRYSARSRAADFRGVSRRLFLPAEVLRTTPTRLPYAAEESAQAPYSLLYGPPAPISSSCVPCSAI